MAKPQSTSIIKYDDITSNKIAEKLTRTLIFTDFKGGRYVVSTSGMLETLSVEELASFNSDLKKAVENRKAVVLNYDIWKVLGKNSDGCYNFLDILEVFGIRMEEE